MTKSILSKIVNPSMIKSFKVICTNLTEACVIMSEVAITMAQNKKDSLVVHVKINKNAALIAKYKKEIVELMNPINDDEPFHVSLAKIARLEAKIAAL